MLNKYDINSLKAINSVGITDYIQKNNISKMINKVKGAEKLASILRGGYNDSLRELLFKISALKDIVNNIKEIFKINMGKFKIKLDI